MRPALHVAQYPLPGLPGQAASAEGGMLYVDFTCLAQTLTGMWLFLLLAKVGGVIAFKLGLKSGYKPNGGGG